MPFRSLQWRFSRPLLVAPRRRCLATKVHPLPKADDGHEDFRPPWVYTWSKLLSYTIIPSIVVYSIFFYDFGDREHVFQPVRRWAAQQKAAFFTLSPAEHRLLHRGEPQSENLDVLPEQLDGPFEKTH